MKKFLFTLAVSCFSVAYAQNLNFTDQKFKALLLSSNSNNDIAKDSTGNYFAIDANGDGEIQVSEAQQVKILNVKLPTFNVSLVPDSVSDVTQFTNVEELYMYHTKTAILNYVNNDKIKKVKFIYNTSVLPSALSSTFNNCSALQDLNNVINDSTYPYFTPQKLTIKNCNNIGSNVSIGGFIKELYLENSSIVNLGIGVGLDFSKLSVQNMSSLEKINLGSGYDFNSAFAGVEFIANNCANLQEIITTGDYYNNSMVYYSSMNLNGTPNLKKIKGLNYPSIDFSNAGLVNLEELDCAFYNRYMYTGSYTGTVTLGNVTAINLSGLPKLKKLLAFNQPITGINFTVCPQLQEIDIVNSACFMSTINVNNLGSLTSLKAYRGAPNDQSVPVNLQQLQAVNCTQLTNLEISGNYELTNINLQNCSSLQKLVLGYHLNGSSVFNNYPELTTLNVTQCSALNELGLAHTKISSVNISDCIALKRLELMYNDYLNQLDVSNNTLLEYMLIHYSPLISQLNTTNNIHLKEVNFNHCPQLTQLDFSTASHLDEFYLWNMSNLLSANIRNNSHESMYVFHNTNPNLSVCVDNNQLNELVLEYPNINFTNSCDITLNTQNTNLDKISIKIFPNPTKDFVEINALETIKNIQIVDTQGKMIFNKNYSQNHAKIDLSSHPSGVYIFKIVTDKNKISKKIIKK